jgi:hypothetical protein
MVLFGKGTPSSGRCAVEFVYFDVVEWSLEAVLIAALLTETLGLGVLAHRWVSR